MVELFRRVTLSLSLALLAGAAAAQSPADPPGRVGRLAYIDGAVSFHDNEQTDWSAAALNTPLTSGDALWTEPNARSEISIAGSRVRLDGGTLVDLTAIDDSQTALQLDQGRLDIKSFDYDSHHPYRIVTPRGTITLVQQGDYYIEAGSTQDPTRLGVRSGAAQIQTTNGQVLAVRAGEVGEVSGDGGAPQLNTIQTAPPPMPAAWAERDRRVIYDRPPQYLSASVTGYEDLNAYGSWVADPQYGQVWSPSSVPSGWEPYRTGHWAYIGRWGWTWIDDQPWGFAPYHYGRWAQRDDRWYWVPPQRDVAPVYAPALVAFIGGVELSVALADANQAPVGWFPLGPREAYVPPYTTNHDYYRRLNAAARVQDQVAEERWQRAQRREAIREDQQNALMNRRFATVVPAQDFVRSRPVARAAIKVSADKLATAPVAPVAAPPAPTQPVATRDPKAEPPKTTPSPKTQSNVPTGQTPLASMPALAKPTGNEAERPKGPGPKVATTRPTAPTDQAKPNLPPLAPRTGAAPPQLRGERTTPQQQPGQPTQAPQPPKPGETPRPEQRANPQATAPQPSTPPAHTEPQRTEPSHPNAPQPPAQRPAETHAPAPTATPPAPPASQAQHPEPTPAPQPPRPAETHTPAPQPAPHVAPPSPGQQGHAAPPQAPPQQHAAPPPQQAHAPAPPPPQQHAAPPPPQQAHAPAPAPQQAHAPAPPPPAAHPAPGPAPAPAKKDEKK